MSQLKDFRELRTIGAEFFGQGLRKSRQFAFGGIFDNYLYFVVNIGQFHLEVRSQTGEDPLGLLKKVLVGV